MQKRQGSCVDVNLLSAAVVSEQSEMSDMRAKRVFLAAIFCCCISLSRLLKIRSVNNRCCPECKRQFMWWFGVYREIMKMTLCAFFWKTGVGFKLI